MEGLLFELDFSALKDPDHDHYHRQNQKYVNESPHGVRGHQSQCPQDQQDDHDGFEHLPDLGYGLAAQCHIE